jgi:antibiotic biosynthesis monooxygenase (ABM) superfamily enzyme
VVASEPVTVTVARRVAPGREAEFEEWAQELIAAASRYDGFLGAGLLRPGHVGNEWHVVYRFDRPANLAAWEESPARADLLSRAERLMKTTGESRVSGLETWFELPGRTAPAPPRWKMFVVSAASLYVLQIIQYLLLWPVAGRWPLPLRLALFVPIVTAAMTWVVMPRLAHLLQDWLYAPARDRAHSDNHW